MAFVGATTLQGDTATTATIAPHASTQNGDTLVAVVSMGAATQTLSSTGWTKYAEVVNQGGSFGFTAAVFIRDHDGSANYTFNSTASERWSIVLTTFDNVTSVDVVSSANTGASTSIVCPDVTTTVADCRIVRCVVTDDGRGPLTGPSGHTEAAQQDYTSAALAGAYYSNAVQSSAGATGTATVTTTGSDDWVGWTVALEESGGAPDTTDPTVAVDQVHGTGHADAVHGGLTLTGTASDNVGVTAVDVRINGGTWNAATNTGTGFSTWSYAVAAGDLTVGSNTIEARASDAATNTGTDTETVWYLPAGGVWTYGSPHLVPAVRTGA